MEKLKQGDILSRTIFQKDLFDPNASNELK